MEFRCTCRNSGTNSYTGQCSNCGMTKPLITLNSTPLTKQSVYNQIRLLVNTTSNDLLLGEAVRKLFV